MTPTQRVELYFTLRLARSHEARTAANCHIEAVFAWVSLVLLSVGLLAVALIHDDDVGAVVFIAAMAALTACAGVYHERQHSKALARVARLDAQIAEVEREGAEECEGLAGEP